MNAQPQNAPSESLQIRIHGDASLPTLVYLPGLHGDWTLVTAFRKAIAGRVRFIEFTYPRTLDWSLDDYAMAIETALAANGIERGWLLGESFGSQILWPLLRRAKFRADGAIIAGGFVRHPLVWAVRCAEHLARGVPLTWITSALFFYARIARWRQHADPDVHASIGEFIARRTELDRAAAAHRLRLIAHHDPRDTARATTLPVFFLSGFFDPIVPWPFVRHWLAYHCPGFRASRILPFSHHAVLSVSPKKSADLIATWMRSAV